MKPIDQKNGSINFETLEFLGSDEIGYAATEFMHFESRPFYPIGALLQSTVQRVWLGVGSQNTSTVSDLIFRMQPLLDQPSGYFFYEITLVTGRGVSYGGWVFGSELKVTDDFFAGHRVIETVFRGERLQFEYSPDLGRYEFRFGDLKGLSTGEIRELAKMRQRMAP